MKNIIGWIISGIGSMSVVIGMMAGVPLMLFVVNNIFYRGNDSGEIVPLYIKNSKQVEVAVPKWKPGDSTSLFWYETMAYKSPLKRDGKRRVLKMIFYSIEFKKYITVMLFEIQGTDKIMLPRIVPNRHIWITFNKDDMNNPDYGSKNNPVPVFKFIVPKNPSGYDKYEVSKDRYCYNVTQYLTYIMSKKEFKSRW